jgi:methylated-DNA-[protein]-cysteine S-methyltransferase
MTYKSIFSSQLGFIEVCSDDAQTINRIYFTNEPSENFFENDITKNAASQISEYFSGKRYNFDFPTSCEGSDFQKSVWEEVRKIPYGETKTYKQIACAIGDDKAFRAVGNALDANKLLLVVPCHRVIGKSGILSGFSAGAMIKEALIGFEKNILKTK